MKRLTGKESYCSYTYCDNQGKCKIENVCYDKKLYDKLKGFENLEEQLESIYGECDGLLETAVKSLVKHEGVDFGKPYKARLLTDEDVDKWEEHKDLEEQGLLLKLPCKIGKNLYDIIEFVEGYESPDIFIIDASRIEISKDKEGLIYTIDGADYREKDFGTVLFTSEEEALKAISEKGWIL